MKCQYPDNGSPSIFTYSLCHVKTLDSMIEILLADVDQAPRGLALKIKAQRLFPSDEFMGVYFLTLADGVKMVVCKYRWECFGCFTGDCDFWGYYFIHIYLLYGGLCVYWRTVNMSQLYIEFIFGLEGEKGCF